MSELTVRVMSDHLSINSTNASGSTVHTFRIELRLKSGEVITMSHVQDVTIRRPTSMVYISEESSCEVDEDRS